VSLLRLKKNNLNNGKWKMENGKWSIIAPRPLRERAVFNLSGNPRKLENRVRGKMTGNVNKYALVLVNIKGLGVKTFSYLIPDEMRM